jgi:hypothetical protein
MSDPKYGPGSNPEEVMAEMDDRGFPPERPHHMHERLRSAERRLDDVFSAAEGARVTRELGARVDLQRRQTA